MTVTTEQLKLRLAGIDQRRRQLEWQRNRSGWLKRHEVWRHTYLAHPYLAGSPDDRVAERFCQIFMNVMELNAEGKIAPVPMNETTEFIEVFTHMLEEYGSRSGGPPSDIICRARAPFARYFEHGDPIGLTMFRGYSRPAGPILVKYGKREFLEPMLDKGNFRLANASSYNDASLLDAVRDDETSRTFFIPTYKDRAAGRSSAQLQGHTVAFGDDDIVLPLVFDDYYLFSLCSHIHYRMPADFEADAALVIRDPIRFTQRLISTVLAQLPKWAPMEGPVTYYDPYRDYSKFKIPEMAKHFGYAYQKEVRVAFKAPYGFSGVLKPIYLSMGSMREFADLVTL